LEVVAVAANAPEADLISQRLAVAGITAVIQRSTGGPEFGESGSRYVYVQATELARAKELLAASEGLSDEELARQSAEAGRGEQ
jgi:hypothetical protein